MGGRQGVCGCVSVGYGSVRVRKRLEPEVRGWSRKEAFAAGQEAEGRRRRSEVGIEKRPSPLGRRRGKGKQETESGRQEAEIGGRRSELKRARYGWASGGGDRVERRLAAGEGQ